MFSSRIPWAIAPNALTTLTDAKRRAGVPVLDLTESNPTRAGLAYPRDAILATLATPGALTYEPAPHGLALAREAVARYYRDALDTAVDPAHVWLTASTSEAYAYLFKLLCNPGERVLVPRPSYPLFEFLAALESVRVEQYALGYDGAWHLDVDTLARAITPDTRAVVVVNPNNPTGSYLKHDERAALIALCQHHGLAIISDEVFTDYPFEPDPRRVRTVASESEVLTFALSGLSKTVGLPQLKLGWIATSGPPALRAAAEARLELIADTFLSVGAPVQHAAPALLALRHELAGQIAHRTRANRRFALDALARDADTACAALHAEGGWYLVLRLPSTQREEAWALELLDRDAVLVHPGYFFDFASEAYIVLSLLTPESTFREGLARILARVHASAR